MFLSCYNYGMTELYLATGKGETDGGTRKTFVRPRCVFRNPCSSAKNGTWNLIWATSEPEISFFKQPDSEPGATQGIDDILNSKPTKDSKQGAEEFVDNLLKPNSPKQPEQPEAATASAMHY